MITIAQISPHNEHFWTANISSGRNFNTLNDCHHTMFAFWESLVSLVNKIQQNKYSSYPVYVIEQILTT